MTDWDNIFDARGNLVDVPQRAEPGPPPDLTWKRVEDERTDGPIIGRVAKACRCGGLDHTLVIVSDLFTDDAGIWVRVISREGFRLWQELPEDNRSRTPTPARAVPAKHVWVMTEKPAERP